MRPGSPSEDEPRRHKDDVLAALRDSRGETDVDDFQGLTSEEYVAHIRNRWARRVREELES